MSFGRGAGWSRDYLLGTVDSTFGVGQNYRPATAFAKGVLHQKAMAELPEPFSTPSVGLFVEVVSKESDWYNLGMFLGAPINELDHIKQCFSKREHNGLLRCYIELYNCLEPLTWEHIATSLRRMGNKTLAKEIQLKYVTLKVCNPPPRDNCRSRDECVSIQHPVIEPIGKDYEKLSERLIILFIEVKIAFEKSNVNIYELQRLVEDKCASRLSRPSLFLAPQARIDEIFSMLKKSCSILNVRPLVSIVELLLKRNKDLRRQLADLERDLDNDFIRSNRMAQLVDLIKEKQAISGNVKIVELDLRLFWNDFTINKFEKDLALILVEIYHFTPQIRVVVICGVGGDTGMQS